MGVYTELAMACELRTNTPLEVIEALRYMVGDREANRYVDFSLDHDLFLTQRWEMMLCGTSYYFPGKTYSTLTYSDISKTHYLTVRCSFKNYCQEIDKFLDWIYPYAYERGFVGYHRHEEHSDPTLIYFGDKGVEKRKVGEYIS